MKAMKILRDAQSRLNAGANLSPNDPANVLIRSTMYELGLIDQVPNGSFINDIVLPAQGELDVFVWFEMPDRLDAFEDLEFAIRKKHLKAHAEVLEARAKLQELETKFSSIL